MSVSYDGRRRLLSAGSLYVDVDKDLKEAYEEFNKDDHQGDLKWSLRGLRAEFKFKGNDILYKYYTSRLQNRFFMILLMLNIVINMIDSFFIFYFKPDFSFPFAALLRLTAIIVFTSFLILAHHNEKWFQSEFARAIASITVLLAMLHAEYGGFLFTLAGDHDTFKWKRVRPVFYLIVCNELLLPYPTPAYSAVTTLLIVVCELTVSLVWPNMSDSSCQELTPFPLNSNSTATFMDYYDHYKYIASDALFYLFAFGAAYYVKHLIEIVVRRAFLDHRHSVESKFKLNFEREQQEQLLSSCLPQHLMKRVKRDIRVKFEMNQNNRSSQSSISRPFTELYIEKYQDVTILYADIVNSMLLTQSLESPQELVQTLNGLFGRFDSKAEANNCLRIKLLGDCYYCVSGIPEYDPNHAVNSINMGIDMIDVIKTVRDEIQVDVNMRIGVHTGMVMSGLLGLKKWQYDIWSLDSMKASQMEHDGKPGYVHVTQKTLDLVPKEITSEFYIIENNVIPNEKTYLIRKSRSQGSIKRHYVKQNSRSENRHYDKTRNSNAGRNSSLSSHRDSRRSAINFSLSEANNKYQKGLVEFINMMTFASDSITQAIDKMPLNLKRQYNISHPSIEINPHFLHFVPKRTIHTLKTSQLRHIHTLDKKKEKLYQQENDPLFPLYLFSSLGISTAITIIRFLTLYDDHSDEGPFFYSHGTIIFYIILAIIGIALFVTYYKKHKINCLYRILIWFAISVLLLVMTCLDTIQCDVHNNLTAPQIEHIENMDKDNANHECLYKWSRYFTYSSALALTSISMFIRINLWLKFSLSTISLIVINELINSHNCSAFSIIDSHYQKEDKTELEGFTPRLAHIQYLFVIYLMFYMIDRQIEYILRLDFLWSTKLKRERNEAKLTREVNQILLKNILPIHVAQHYLFNNPDPFGEEGLYYEAYNTIAVMFATIPNFFEFYNESGEDGGLNHLRILNEIISEFDRLLLFPSFKKIEKIKTIGSTYMAASGLQPGRGSTDSVISCEEEIENLLVLIRFAMAMNKSLNRFNSHSNATGLQMDFKLRIGIALGPVVAGVVGSVKPQYDIWGDTVNVASRMDSNGVTDKIHTTEKVADVLEEYSNEYKPYCRGPMNIKGKGLMNTYLIDCESETIEELFGFF